MEEDSQLNSFIQSAVLLSAFYMLGATLGTRDMGMGEKDRKQTNKKQTLRSESLLSVGETGHKNMKNISSITW